MAGLASINVKFKVDLSEFSTQMQNVVRSIDKAGQKMQSVGRGMSAAITLPILAAGAASVKFASDYEESINKVDVAFKESSGEVKGWAKTTIDSFGIAEGTALDMAALFGDMATSMGLTQPAAAKMSTSLVGLAGDLASFKNIGIDEATTALNGVFTGETESLKRLGVVMTEANLAQFALNQGITKQIKDMSQAEKVQLRYNYVMEQTKNAQGDFSRTSGGAANQMRTLGEVLKEIGASFGKIILPYFTKVVSAINDIAKKFKDLDESTKTVIVVIAGLAAAIGPLLFSIGALMSAVPLVVSGFTTIKTAFTALSATIAANPIGALLVALGAITSVLLISTVRFRELTNAEKEFSTMSAKATESIAKEKSQLEQYLTTAKNDKLSKEERQAAIKKLNELSPQYLGNLTLETINTDAAKKATDEYVNSLVMKAKVMAAQEKLVTVQKQLLDLQMGQNDAVKPSIWQELTNRFLSFGDAGRYAILNTKAVSENLSEENSELLKLQGMLTSFIQQNNEFIASNGDAADSVGEVVAAVQKGPEKGSVAFYEAQIAEVKKFRDEHKLTAEQYAKYGDDIAKTQKKIDDIQGKRKQLESVDTSGIMKGLQDSPELKKVKEIQALIDQYKQLQQTQIEGSAQWLAYEKVIQDHAANINKIVLSVQVNREPLKLLGEDMVTSVDIAKAKAAEWSAAYVSIANSATSAFSSIIDASIAGMEQAETGMGRFLQALMANVAKVLATQLSTALAFAVAGASEAAASTTVAAPVTLPVFLAQMMGAVFAAFAAIPKFETGGIVGGSSYYGDKILARVNSGEAIFNQKQQKNLWGMLNPAASDGMGLQLNGVFEVDGAKLKLVLDRTEKIKNRLG